MRALILFLLFCGACNAQVIPERAKLYAPLLAEEQAKVWPSVPTPWTIAGQIEQETCPSLRHSKCWNPGAELRTSREHGVGLGQFTKAYDSAGRVRFDKLTELSQQYASLRGWSWRNWREPSYQLTAVVEMDKAIYGRVYDAASDDDRWAFTLAAYNGGESGVRQDRLLCSQDPGCDRRVWFGNVEYHSLKTRKVNPGYGESAFDINRHYVRNVLFIRRAKYKPFFGASNEQNERQRQ